ncbi:MAG: hypothetical protein RIR16_221 [Actinomycetota bacterium]
MKIRFYLRDSERKVDPEPVKTNVRAVLKVGLVLWSLALVACLFFAETLSASENSWFLTACSYGILLGLLGLVKFRNR